MTEISRFWDGNPGIGDGSVAPYDAGTEFAEVMIGVAGLSSDPDKGGVIGNVAGALNVTSPAAGQIRVSPGEALVYGTWYKNDANVDFTIATPATAARTDIVVVRKDWAAQTCRLAVVTGTEGSGPPVLTQNVGTVWEIPVGRIDVDAGGIIVIVPANVRADFWYRTDAATIRTDNNIEVGRRGSGYGGQARFVDDTGLVRWMSGVSGGAGGVNYVIQDWPSGRKRIEIEPLGRITISSPDGVPGMIFPSANNIQQTHVKPPHALVGHLRWI